MVVFIKNILMKKLPLAEMLRQSKKRGVAFIKVVEYVI